MPRPQTVRFHEQSVEVQQPGARQGHGKSDDPAAQFRHPHTLFDELGQRQFDHIGIGQQPAAIVLPHQEGAALQVFQRAAFFGPAVTKAERQAAHAAAWACAAIQPPPKTRLPS